MHLNSNLASNLLEVLVRILCRAQANIASNFLTSGTSRFLTTEKGAFFIGALYRRELPAHDHLNHRFAQREEFRGCEEGVSASFDEC